MTASDKLKLLEVREQIQEDIISYVDAAHHDFPQGRKICDEMLEQIKDDICQIVINNFMNIEG
jgi:hypothetical protein